MQQSHSLKGFEYIPEILQPRIQQHWEHYLQAAQEQQVAIPETKEFLQTVYRIFACSEFVAENAIRFPEILTDLFSSGDIIRVYDLDEYSERLQQLLSNLTEEKLFTVLRQFRRREMVRLIWRDLAMWSDLEMTMRDLSALADACIHETAQYLFRQQCNEWGTTENYRNQPQTLLVLGLGKLGGQELNLSSDVDLIFAYPTPGKTNHPDKALAHEEFFHRLGQKLIQALNTVTTEGFVFRVDMRLRPLGATGPLVMSFHAMENYYLEQGRNWERYALIKARVVSGDLVAAAKLMNILRPFVYRRYLDYSAIQALREMHALITQETKNKKLQGHVKLGAGGIREVEFIGQVFQLIRGGQEPRLQNRRIIPILKLLGELRILSAAAVKQLLAAYTFLRRVEHCLQAVNDRQTHQLPDPTDTLGQTRLAFAMNFSNWEAFITVLQEHQTNVSQHFQQLIAQPELKEKNHTTPTFAQESIQLWLKQTSTDKPIDLLIDMGFGAHAEETWQVLQGFRDNRRYSNLAELGRQRVDALVPKILPLAGNTEYPLATLKRLLTILEAIMRRSVYVLLLLENPKALEQLIQLCSISPGLADHLARYPLLLGELLDSNRLYAPLDPTALAQSLQQAVQVIQADDLEQQMECLRRFKLQQLFRVAVLDVTGVLPLMRVSDHLTNIAETILRQVQQLAWQHLISKHGYPPSVLDEPNFAIIAYGKLGGIELGYGSDLDLVFLYDEPPGISVQGLTSGQQPISTGVFYNRLAQRMLNMLSARTPSGFLYAVDTRLRPSGESGLLVTSMNTFCEYQRQHAWTWEHQALVRARMISGSANLIQRFDLLRQEVLTHPRDTAKLTQEIRTMRQKMREAGKPLPPKHFDLKHSFGCITDIEFIVQYLVLRWAHEYPALLVYPDNIRILESLAAEGLLAIPTVRLISDAYRAYRAILHRLDLQDEPSFVPENQLRSYREQVQEAWREVFEFS